jgi:hypothetical protein
MGEQQRDPLSVDTDLRARGERDLSSLWTSMDPREELEHRAR